MKLHILCHTAFATVCFVFCYKAVDL